MTYAHAATLVLSAAVVGILVPACDDAFRPSGEGESCQQTNDCAAPLRCVAFVCVGPASGAGGGNASSSSADGTSTATATTTTSVSSTSASTNASSSTGTILDPTLCAMCLDEKCGAQLAACDDACHDVEACIEATCKNLVENSLPEEGMCQAYCQQEHPGGKQHHLAVANCSQVAPCGPCSSNPLDYDDCRAKADQGACADEKMACTADLDCVQYKNCAATCGTLNECVQCQSGAAGLAGYAKAFAYEQCIALECIAESWLP
ncbi:MAG: hypothetical protein U0414_11890 [Polyangiaceae bacterium]